MAEWASTRGPSHVFSLAALLPLMRASCDILVLGSSASLIGSELPRYSHDATGLRPFALPHSRPPMP